jgi:hypothetical protein
MGFDANNETSVGSYSLGANFGEPIVSRRSVSETERETEQNKNPVGTNRFLCTRAVENLEFFPRATEIYRWDSRRNTENEGYSKHRERRVFETQRTKGIRNT